MTRSDVTKFAHARFHNDPDQQVFKDSVSHTAKTLPKPTGTRVPNLLWLSYSLCVLRYVDNTWHKDTDPPSLRGPWPRKTLSTQTDDYESEQEDEDDDVIDNDQVRTLLTIHRHIPDETKCFEAFRVTSTSCESNEETVRRTTTLLKTERLARLSSTTDD